MTNTTSFSDFTNLYSLSKTLRFELIPQGKTLYYIEKKDLLNQDKLLADDFQKVKKFIDAYHRDFIEKALSKVQLRYEEENGQKDSLVEFYNCYKSERDDKQKKLLTVLCNNLRNQIVKAYISEELKEKFKTLFTTGLIDELVNFTQDEEEKKLIQKFEKFTTYFTNFHENRKNMYTNEEHSTSIAYRLIHENLPKFIDNIEIFEKIKKSDIGEQLQTLYDNLNLKNAGIASIEDVFSLKTYGQFLTQSQIDVYNLILGGKSEEPGIPKIQGLNEYINLYNQKQTEKSKKLPKLIPLFKQILSERNAISWLPEVFGNDNEVLKSIEDFYRNLVEQGICKNEADECRLSQLLQSLKDYEDDKLSGIYILNDSPSLTSISQQLFGSRTVIQRALDAKFAKESPKKKNETDEKFAARKDKFLKNHDSFSIKHLNESLNILLSDVNEKDETNCTKNITDYFWNLGKKENAEDLFSQVKTHYKAIEQLLKTEYPTQQNLAQNKDQVEKIKLFLDSIKAIQWFVKPLLCKGDEIEKDMVFYVDLSELYRQLDDITKLYDKVRNYITKKPYSEEKIKLNFENSTLLNGWDVNKEMDNTSVILRKKGLFYLGIMDKSKKKLFDQKKDDTDEKCYEKMEYKYFPGLTKMIPKCAMTKEVRAHFEKEQSDDYYTLTNNNFSEAFVISRSIFELYDQKKFQADYWKNDKNGFDENEFKEAISTWIKFCITFLKAYKSTNIYDLGLVENKIDTYENVGEFYKDVNPLLYQITFRKILEKNVTDFVEDGSLYLFQIYNKDFSTFSKGTPNMHTLYWEMLFDTDNLKNVVYKLNGEAEVFYRKASINKEDAIVHKANEAIENKNELNTKKTSCFRYDIIKNRRYTSDKFQFHVPITMNFKAQEIKNINFSVNKYLQENLQENDIYVIGIDRGERHLLYLSLINLQGEIVKQFSLNEIVNQYNGNTYKTNYHSVLNKREGARMEARKSWQTIETIKELKEGYISQVIHKITDLMIEYKAIVVLEDLNFGFMRGRQKVEKAVYQKFEKMLIDKLNYLVDKKKEATEDGGILKAFQLTNKFESFQKVGKQSGFLFYVPAWNTSKICPVTGFVNLFDTHYENIEKAKSFFSKFDTISFNRNKNYFEFKVTNYTDFSEKAKETKTDWLICTNDTRIETFRDPENNNQWVNKEINLTDEFLKLLPSEDCDLKQMIQNQNEKSFFERLLYLFKMTVQMRNSVTNSEVDYLISPVAGPDGVFYDSREYAKLENANFPKDADANGAYNIARKGLWVLKQIKEANDLNKIKLAISNKEWLQFVQEKQ
ncbi:MAG: type V CRISPR-associated protein Cas12a/Cpf1 [Bacteroidales bacterium]